MDEDTDQLIKRSSAILPMLPLRGIAVFPNMLLHFDAERSMSMAAISGALTSDQRIFLVTQKDMFDERPRESGLYKVGTICQIKQILRIPEHGMRVMVEGITRAKLINIVSEKPYFAVEVQEMEDEPLQKLSKKAEALIRESHELFEAYAVMSDIQPESMAGVLSSDDPGFIADFIAQNTYIKHTEKQKILEESRPLKRLEKIVTILRREVEILEIRNDLLEKTGQQVVRGQREYYLREQLKVLKSELGEGDEPDDELDEYRDKILALGLITEHEEKLLKEVDRLAKQPFGASEAALIRSYLDICLALPWTKKTRDRLDIQSARRVLDADHFGLEKIKERIIEFLAVKKLAPEIKGTILCFVGPPGVGKTSVASSIATALGRKFARISLGGIHDEAEIRGHRKTYVGAMPGRIISAVRQAGTKNPLILLDEVDKLGSDYRGDPSAALLEALDSEQNHAFRDNFLEIPFDLSDTIFITTANTMDTIPRPLLDRMEIIELGSYTDEEKLQIAKRHLMPKQRKKHGLTARQLKINDAAVRDIIAGYTRESGVRQLERELARICRRTAAKIAEGDAKSASVTSSALHDYLGVRKFKIDVSSPADEVGIVKGLAWTQVGGEILEIEVNVLEGKGKLELTGNLGDVMKESAKTALSYIRGRSGVLGIEPEFHKNRDIHIHFPEGAVPKDGPSAGIAIAIALISALTGVPVRRDIAMTGEITLRGRILPIGGLREKTMAALRNNIRTVIIPAENEKDLENIDTTVKSSLNFIIADHIDKVLHVTLGLSALPQKSDPAPTDIIPSKNDGVINTASLKQ